MRIINFSQFFTFTHQDLPSHPNLPPGPLEDISFRLSNYLALIDSLAKKPTYPLGHPLPRFPWQIDLAKLKKPPTFWMRYLQGTPQLNRLEVKQITTRLCPLIQTEDSATANINVLGSSISVEVKLYGLVAPLGYQILMNVLLDESVHQVQLKDPDFVQELLSHLRFDANYQIHDPAKVAKGLYRLMSVHQEKLAKEINAVNEHFKLYDSTGFTVFSYGPETQGVAPPIQVGDQFHCLLNHAVEWQKPRSVTPVEFQHRVTSKPETPAFKPFKDPTDELLLGTSRHRAFHRRSFKFRDTVANYHTNLVFASMQTELLQAVKALKPGDLNTIQPMYRQAISDAEERILAIHKTPDATYKSFSLTLQ